MENLRGERCGAGDVFLRFVLGLVFALRLAVMHALRCCACGMNISGYMSVLFIPVFRGVVAVAGDRGLHAGESMNELVTCCMLLDMVGDMAYERCVLSGVRGGRTVVKGDVGS